MALWEWDVGIAKCDRCGKENVHVANVRLSDGRTGFSCGDCLRPEDSPFYRTNVEPVFGPNSKDERGASWRIILPNGQEAILIFTKKGYLRGGHSHNVPETSLLLTGRLRYYKIRIGDVGKETVSDLSAGESSHNEPGEVHMALALEDYWLLDWRIGAKIGETVTTNYEPYRGRVRDQLLNMPVGTVEAADY